MKEAFYFSHDYNARADVKIKSLIRCHGMLGYGIYWSIVEDLYQNENSIPLDYESVAFDLRCSADVIKSIINDFDLFVIQDGSFGSLSVQKRIDDRNVRSSKARVIASRRWNKTDSPQRKKADECIFYVLRVYNESEEFIKCGITTESVSRRYSGKMNGYQYDVAYQLDASVSECLSLERQVSETFNKYTPTDDFAGKLECLEISQLQSVVDFAMRKNKLRNAGSEIRNANKGKESKGKESKEKEDIKALPPIKNHPIVDWIEKNTPTLNKMKQPLTNDEAQRLMEDLKIVTDAQKQKLKNIMLNMENYKPLLSKSKSTNLTIRNWWKRDTDNGRTETVDLSYKKPTGEKYVR
jgi:hypothetical protein